MSSTRRDLRNIVKLADSLRFKSDTQKEGGDLERQTLRRPVTQISPNKAGSQDPREETLRPFL